MAIQNEPSGARGCALSITFGDGSGEPPRDLGSPFERGDGRDPRPSELALVAAMLAACATIGRNQGPRFVAFFGWTFGSRCAHLGGRQRDEVACAGRAVMITRRRCPEKLSTAAGAPFERR
jgi:hypothetical protein